MARRKRFPVFGDESALREGGAKELLFGEQARQSLKAGIDIVANAIGATMGPKGRNVAIMKRWYVLPTITNQGVAVADEIDGLGDMCAGIGAQLIREAAQKTGKEVGDGTTAATVLAQAIIAEGLKNIAAGANPMFIKRGIEKAAQAAVEDIKAMAKKIEDNEEVAWVATSSAENEETGRLLAEAVEKVGETGMIITEWDKAGRFGITVEYTDRVGQGLKYDKGYVSPYFVTDSKRLEAVVDDPYILITDKEISNPNQLVPVLDKLRQIDKKEFVLIAKKVTEAALSLLIVNNRRGVFNCLAVKPPKWGELQKNWLRDIAILTGGIMVSDEAGHLLETTMISDLGQAGKVSATIEETRIVGGKGDPEAIEAHLEELKRELRRAELEHEIRYLRERVALFSGGVALMKVGGATNTEIEEKKGRLDDALMAVRAALEEGVVPGGGVPFLNAISALDRLEATGDEAVGIQIVRRALEQPMRQIAKNAGHHSAAVVANVQRLQKEEDNENIGYDVMTEEYVDMMDRGIIDPAKVARVALENAASCAAMILTTDVLVARIPRYEPPPEPSEEDKRYRRGELPVTLP